MKIDFESFLAEIHAEQYEGTKNVMVDDFNEWLSELPIDDCIAYANQYTEKLINLNK